MLPLIPCHLFITMPETKHDNSPNKTYCCEIAQQDKVSMIGTAVQVDVWLLLEYPYAWKSHAVEDNLLPKTITKAFQRLTQEFDAVGLKLRVQLIKQAKSDLQAPRLFFADGRDSNLSLRTTCLSGYDAFPELSAEGLLNDNNKAFDDTAEEIYLICTNGQRDVCCSKAGRPLYSRLNETFGERIWQTTHLGGHRYAPNLLCLPSGYVYGFVDPNISVGLVKNHDQNSLDIERLRGRSHYSPAKQAGEIYARLKHDITSREAIDCNTSTETIRDHLTIQYSGTHSGEISLHKKMRSNPSTSCDENPKPSAEFLQVQ